MTDFRRAYPLEACSIRAGGDGRTVDAYAATFVEEATISDQDGQYIERISPTSFTKTLAERGTKFGVLFNHGQTIYGTPSERGSMPIGVPLEVRADTRGLVTVTQYNKTPLAEETLEAIRSGSITAQSFQGRFLQSDIATPRGGFRADAAGTLPRVTRTEVRLIEYGPAVFPAYAGAEIVGVRAEFAGDPLLRLILDGFGSALDPLLQALTASPETAETARRVIDSLVTDPLTDPADVERFAVLATRLTAPVPRSPLARKTLIAAPLRARGITECHT